MNRVQKLLGFIAFALFCVSVLAAPWRVDYMHAGSVRLAASYVIYGPLFSAPTQRQEHFITVATLLWQPLVFTWIAIAIAYASLFFLVRSRSERHDSPQTTKSSSPERNKPTAPETQPPCNPARLHWWHDLPPGWLYFLAVAAIIALIILQRLIFS
jgi:hypothetical protein